jgi:hypothetical protein
MRLAQLKIHDTPGPLLPSLKQLRVVQPNELSISQLPLFFTESLRSLEATGVPTNQQSAFLSFLITLIGEAPLLSTITLGPGSFTSKCLNACLKFDHLSHLEILDAASSITFKFLVAIGGLPELETFILNARTATYKSPSVAIVKQDVLSSPVLQGPECSAFRFHFGAPSQTPLPNPTPIIPTNSQPCELINTQSPSDSLDRTATVGRFYRLRRLDITGSLPLIRDLYEHVISTYLERLGMTLVHVESPADVQKGQIKKSSANIKPTPVSKIDLEIDSFFALVKNAVVEKWPLTLKSVRLGHLPDYRVLNDNGKYSDPPPVTLPFTAFAILLKHEVLEDLEISGWALPYNSENKHPIDEILQAALPNLKTMRLPVHSPTPGIQIDQLLPIVRAFPRLVSLQCGFEQPGTCLIPMIPVADIPLHGLKVFSVGHQDQSAIDLKQQLRIASFLDILFPNLEQIETHTGHSAEVWAYIYEFIKMCQASRINHANRLSCGAQLSQL